MSSSPRTLFASGYGGLIYTLSFTPSSSLSSKPSLSITSSISCGTAPTWISPHPSLPLLYATDEFAPKEGVLHVFEVSKDGKLKELGKTGTGGEGPAHFAFKKLGDGGLKGWVANYGGGTMGSVRLSSDGAFLKEKDSQVFKYSGSGPNKERQEASHPHGIFLDPREEYVFCVDLGVDMIHVYKILEEGRLEESESIKVKVGNGPRHLTFGKTKSGETLIYLLNELSNTISVYSFIYPSSTTSSTTSPEFNLLQSEISMFPSSVPSSSSDGYTAAEIALTPSHSHLIVSNRSPDSPSSDPEYDVIAIFPLLSDGTLEVAKKKEVRVKGRGLRHFVMDKRGEWIAVGCQKTSEAVVFRMKYSGGEGEEGGHGGELELELEEVARVGGVKDVTALVWA